MRPLALSLIAIGALVGGAQCIPVDRSAPPVAGDLAAPGDVAPILRTACYDCHSNETAWPWYSAVAPVSWLIRRDVTAGRQRLNFSEWADYASDPETAARKLAEISTAMADGDMAPWYYRLLHPRARLTRAERAILIRWATAAAHAPAR
jgi:Haem-binding domain